MLRSGARLQFIQLGRPTHNAFAEGANGRFGDGRGVVAALLPGVVLQTHLNAMPIGLGLKAEVVRKRVWMDHADASAALHHQTQALAPLTSKLQQTPHEAATACTAGVPTPRAMVQMQGGRAVRTIPAYVRDPEFVAADADWMRLAGRCHRATAGGRTSDLCCTAGEP